MTTWYLIVAVHSGRGLYAYRTLSEAEAHLAAEFSPGFAIIERRER